VADEQIYSRIQWVNGWRFVGACSRYQFTHAFLVVWRMRGFRSGRVDLGGSKVLAMIHRTRLRNIRVSISHWGVFEI